MTDNVTALNQKSSILDEAKKEFVAEREAEVRKDIKIKLADLEKARKVVKNLEHDLEVLMETVAEDIELIND